MRAIVSVTLDWGIGLNGRLLVRNAADMRRFEALTTGDTVVMGRVTYQSLPNGALKNRRNIVVTTNEGFEADGAEVAHSVAEVLRMVEGTDADRVWLIGGEILYRELLPNCSEAFVTYNRTHAEADAYFPNLDEDASWTFAEAKGAGTTKDGINYEFCWYVRNRGQR